MGTDEYNSWYSFPGDAEDPVSHFVSTSFIFSKNRRASPPGGPNFASISRALFHPAETSLNTSLFTSLSTARRMGTSSATSLTTLMRFKRTDVRYLGGAL